MKKGNPAAALAIIASIFGAAGVICLLPDGRSDHFVQAAVLPARPAFVITTFADPAVAQPAISGRLERPVVTASPTVSRAITVPEIRVADPVVLALQFSNDAGAPPTLAATHLSFVSAPAMPLSAEPPMLEDRRMGPVPAAFDRTGSALALAFKKTGASVKTAFSVLAP